MIQASSGRVEGMERTLVLLKPDTVSRGLIGEVIARLERKAYTIERLELVTPTSEQLTEHYDELKDKPFFPPLLEYMTSGPIVSMIVEGDRVIEGVRSLAGVTDPTVAAPGTIRGDFGRAWEGGPIMNLIHASDSPESAEREISIWFS